MQLFSYGPLSFSGHNNRVYYSAIVLEIGVYYESITLEAPDVDFLRFGHALADDPPSSPCIIASFLFFSATATCKSL